MKESFRAGFVAIIGKPNVGKSTLINRYVGEKISIVSPRPQTTRNKVLAILTTENYQIIFVDTPGIHRPKHKLGEYMVREAERGLNDADVILTILDGTTGIQNEDELILKLVSKIEKRKILAVNKVDLVKKAELLPIVDRASKVCKFDEYLPISALNGDKTDILLDKLVSFLPESPPLYPEDQLTDRTERFHVAEIIREKILLNTRQEIPHSVAVVIEDFIEDDKKPLIRIRATIYVERGSQKKIVIGEKGRLLKKIGREARLELESFLGKKVYLGLWVKVYEKWRKNNYALKRFGYG